MFWFPGKAVYSGLGQTSGSMGNVLDGSLNQLITGVPFCRGYKAF